MKFRTTRFEFEFSGFRHVGSENSEIYRKTTTSDQVYGLSDAYRPSGDSNSNASSASMTADLGRLADRRTRSHYIVH